MTRAWLAGAALVATGCLGDTGTVALTIVTAPGSDVLDDVTHVKLVLDVPYTVVEAERDEDGSFELELDVIANAQNGQVLFLGEDADGTLLAYGRTPPLPIAAIDADLAIYVAAPRSMALAAESLGVGRTAIGSALLEYGVVLAGGRDADGAPTADLEIYNAYDHELQRGEDMPEARAALSLGTGVSGYAYVFGGTDAEGDARGSLWRFDTTVEPAGAWFEADEDATLARSGAALAPLGNDVFLITGSPPLLIEGLLLRTTPFDEPTTLGGVAATVQVVDAPGSPIYTVVVGEGAGDGGVTRVSGGEIVAFDAPADALRTGHGIVSTVEDKIIAIGGRDATGLLSTAIRCDPVIDSYTSVADVLLTPRTEAAVAATATVIVVAGGRDADGEVLGDVELLDASTLGRLGTIPLVVPRAGAVARPLPNQQVLIVGGVDADGVPVDEIELFTPEPPELPE